MMMENIFVWIPDFGQLKLTCLQVTIVNLFFNNNE